MIPQASAKLQNLFSPRSWLTVTQTTILSAAFIITVANIFSSITGLIKERLLIQFFFDTPAMQQQYEAFQIAFQIPDLLFQLIILGAMSAAFIPVFKELTAKKDEQAAFVMTNTVMNILLLVFIAAAIVAFIFAYPITAYRTGSQFGPEQVAVAARLTRIMLLAQICFAISNFFSSLLQSYRRFMIPAIAPIFYNFGIVLGAYVFKSRWGIDAAAIGVVIGALSHMLLQLPAVLMTGWRWRPTLRLSAPGVKQLFSLIPPRVSTYALTQFQELSLGFLATSLPGGLGYVVIRLALRLMTLPIRLFGVAIGQAALPFLSEKSALKSRNNFRVLLTQSLHQITYLTIPASVLLIILRIPIVRLAYGARNVPWEVTKNIALVVAILSLSIAAQAAVQLIIRGFHALQDTKTPLAVTAFAVCTYLITAGGFVFWTSAGLVGIALGTSVAAFMEFFLFIYLLDRKIGNIFNASLFVPQLKMYLAGFLMAVFLYLPFRTLDQVVFDTTRTIELLGLTVVTSTIGMVAYLYFSALLQIRELTLFTRAFSSFGKWRSYISQTDEVIVDVSGDDEGL